ncbi:helix-turn-helix transcriptional regulator [Clostridium botulinum]|uniref:Transcriptional regulator n=1 Tax=Clostridium botulinum (strain Eklund 17B / Type B) TaxID=935198 RepID=B2TMD3_CLOBB|nr:transcriptional regulator [Clostridium botulinum B str. Eklund 17B (NRP)]MBY6976788.1 helix-turn-helix transcriptional regulator [Clostridium botulinum]MBY7002281.1 helix-turn-helix transcriptional regulator [Clostridium botulinum]MCR1274116.1 helix-turn-helix transcriptional regulator [Clostridium botulinum]NFD68795.1 helix-turn-helix transcriptional regulator [Clostridium botulinum]
MLADKVKYLRNNLNLTQEELANKLGISQSSIGMIERNKRPAGRKMLIKLADFFNVTVDYLLSDSDENNSVNDGGVTKDNKKTIEKDFPIIPEEFTDPNEARAYIMKHQIFAYGGFYPEKMSDEDILNFANEMIEQSKLIRYKYESKNK